MRRHLVILKPNDDVDCEFFSGLVDGRMVAGIVFSITCGKQCGCREDESSFRMSPICGVRALRGTLTPAVGGQSLGLDPDA